MPRRVSAIICLLVFCFAFSPVLADVVVVVSKESPLTSLDRTELADIYLGRLSRLPNGEPVVPIDQEEGSAARDEFYSGYLGRSPVQIKSHWSKLIFTGRGHPPRSASSGLAVAELVAEDPNAIGYIDRAHVNDGLRILPVD